jgi:putative endonuclease
VAREAAATGPTTKQLGDAAEQAALSHLLQRGMRLLQRNFRTPGRGGGEIDLVMRDTDGTLVFVEVRRRRSERHGGAAASVGMVKQRRLVFAARHYLARLAHWPPCRFDVVTVGAADADHWQIDWLPGAFDASGYV